MEIQFCFLVVGSRGLASISRLRMDDKMACSIRNASRFFILFFATKQRILLMNRKSTILDQHNTINTRDIPNVLVNMLTSTESHTDPRSTVLKSIWYCGIYSARSQEHTLSQQDFNISSWYRNIESKYICGSKKELDNWISRTCLVGTPEAPCHFRYWISKFFEWRSVFNWFWN